MRAAKSKAGRPRIPLSNISDRKSDGLTGSPSPAPYGEGNAQLAKGGAAKKRMDKKRRGEKKIKRADGGGVDEQQKALDTQYYNKLKSMSGLSQSDRDRMQTPEGRANAEKGDDHESDMEPQSKKSGGWIKKAHLKKGAFTAQAKHAGKTVHEMAEEHKGDSGKMGKRARLALTFQKMAKNKK